MSLGEYLRRVPEREHRLWLAHFDLEMERPSRTDHYLMALRAEVASVPYLVWGKKPPEIRLADLALTFRPAERSGDGGGPGDGQPADRETGGDWQDVPGAPKLPRRFTKDDIARIRAAQARSARGLGQPEWETAGGLPGGNPVRERPEERGPELGGGNRRSWYGG